MVEHTCQAHNIPHEYKGQYKCYDHNNTEKVFKKTQQAIQSLCRNIQYFLSVYIKMREREIYKMIYLYFSLENQVLKNQQKR